MRLTAMCTASPGKASAGCAISRRHRALWSVIERYGLKSVVFVEALSAGVLGLDLLKELVDLVEGRGHEVALHIHTEWLPYLGRPLLGDRYGQAYGGFLGG
jgi:hypothetical protein